MTWILVIAVFGFLGWEIDKLIRKNKKRLEVLESRLDEVEDRLKINS